MRPLGGQRIREVMSVGVHVFLSPWLCLVGVAVGGEASG
ncbi:hypothetical protein WDL1CHR_02865 [Variovorax sp. WDL1]|nr:hypothetical protein CHC07_00037 [Variovorax sp. B4]PNG61897.1 hypothetical protein CHC06_01799 [Variovorax sp. B2]VTV12028.1 hypothetical protein WDL1CHR_02865 [Variovorax sp. WDL1]